MSKRNKAILTAILLFCLFILGTSRPAASEKVMLVGSTAINWWVFGSEGGLRDDTNITVNGTLGQPITGGSSDTATSLGAGYWYGIPAVKLQLFIPLLQLKCSTQFLTRHPPVQ